MVLKLFDGSDGSDDDTEDISNIQINKDFARRYEHNKKREDLQRLEELKKKGIVDDSDSDSDESSEEEITLDDGKKDFKFFDALTKIINKDPILTSKAKLFESDEGEDDEEEEEEENGGKGKGKGKGKEKPMHLKDVIAKLLIEEGPDFEEREEEERMGVKSYNDEQEELRRAVVDATMAALDGDDDGGELLKKKEAKFDEDDDDGGETNKKLDEYFGDDEELDKDSKFLKDYFKKKLYLDRESNGKMVYADEVEFSEDEEEIEKQEEYERQINFRYEEDAGDRVLGHSRIVEGSVRNKPNVRKEQRKRKEERMAQAEFERNEELKHLKNLKKKETKEKLKKIMETGGIVKDRAFALDEDDLEEPFDEEKYDKKMKEMFDDDYYEANDEDPEFGSDRYEDGEFEKPNFNKEDELLGLEKGWDNEYGSSDGFLAFRKRKLESKNEEEEVVEEGEKKKKKRKRSSLEEEVIKKELEEYYKLDYEDTIGDLKTRFKYRPVNAKRFGLSTEEVLKMDEKELNQYVPLKKIAPYREKEWEVPRNKIHKLKHEKKSVHEGDGSVGKGKGKKERSEEKKSTEVEKVKTEASEANGATNKLSRRSKRRQRQAELKLPTSRLMAYGKIPSQHKSKKKKKQEGV